MNSMERESFLEGDDDVVAFFFAEENRGVTRRELRESARSFAGTHHETLNSIRIARRPLAIEAEPTLPALVALAAALQTGTAILPLHPLESEARKSAFFAETGAPYLLEASGALRQLAPCDGELPPLPEGAAIALATSGTSGAPKWVLHSFDSLLASVRLHRENIPWCSDDRWLLSLPFSHVGGFGVLFRGLVDRKPTVIARSIRPGDVGYESRLEELGVTLLSLVPTQLSRLAQSQAKAPRTLRVALVGGASLSPTLRARALGLGYPVVATYGLTEFGSQVVTQKLGSTSDDVGSPLTGNVIRLAERNRIEISGPSAMLGYWGRTDAFDPTGFFRTSDHGVLTTEGKLRVLGRLDHIIISGGENVAPELVEATALELDAVIEALAYGEADAEWGERVCLDLVLGATLPEREVDTHLRRRLPAYAVPKKIRVVEALARTTSGKVSRANRHS